MRIFLTVAEGGSFAGAARSLGLTPSTVTRAVARVETALGQQLLLRTTRQVSLTDAGALVAARYGPILRDLDSATEDFTRAALPDQGRLRINAPLSFGMRVLPDFAARFHAAYPGIDLAITLSDTLVDIIEEPFDLSIRISGAPSDKSTIWRKVCEVPRFAVAAPLLLARLPRIATPEDLPRAACLSYSETRQPETWTLTKGAQRRDVRAGTGMLSNNGDLLLGLARNHQGIAVLPEFLVAEDLAAGSLQQVLPDWQVRPLWLTLFYPPYEKFPPLVATFTEFFETHIRNMAHGGFHWD